MQKDVISVLVESLNAASAAAADAVEAHEARLGLLPVCEGWRKLDGSTATMLSGEAARPATATVVRLGDFDVRVCPARDSFVTDLVDLHIDLLNDGSETLARLVLHGVPDGWKARSRQRALNSVALLVRAQLQALQNAPAIIAAPMLALTEELGTLDSSINVPSLLGFLRVLSGKQPTRAQIIAMQIAGLLEGPGGKAPPADISLTDTAQQILGQCGIDGRIEREAASAIAEPEAPSETPARNDAELRPFALLRIMERQYAIAEESGTGQMAFRANEDQGWRWLNHTSADGWTRIAAEIIQSDIDVVREFIRMHIIRRRDLPADEIAEAFELLGQIFWLRLTENGVEMRLPQDGWMPLDVDRELPLKDRAVAAGLALHAQDAIAADAAARDWAMRMAHSAQVTPYMAIAAE